MKSCSRTLVVVPRDGSVARPSQAGAALLETRRSACGADLAGAFLAPGAAARRRGAHDPAAWRHRRLLRPTLVLGHARRPGALPRWPRLRLLHLRTQGRRLPAPALARGPSG